jgi:hypothetical protein
MPAFAGVALELLGRVPRRLAARSLTATGTAGIGLALAICATGWFTAGARSATVKGVLALGAGYLALLAARGLTDPAVVPGTVNLDRQAWAVRLAERAFECLAYAGLTAGAARLGWTGMWQLGLSLLALVAVRETLRACSPAAVRPESQAGWFRWAVLALAGEPLGARVLLIVVVAPIWGPRIALVALLDWTIVAVGLAFIFGTAAWQRRRPPRERKPQRTEAVPTSLAVMLRPGRPAELEGKSTGGEPGREPIAVLRMRLKRPPHDFADASLADASGPGVDAGFAHGSTSDASFVSASFADGPRGESDFVGASFGGAPAADAGYADGPAGGPSFRGGPRGESGTTGGRGAAYPEGPERDSEEAFDQEVHQGLAGAWTLPPREDKVTARMAPALAVIMRCRDDGPIARRFGALVRGQLIPLPPALLALVAVALLAHLGFRDLPGFLLLAPPIVMLVAAPGASHPHDGRLDWVVPGVLLGAQFIYMAALGFATGVPPAITFLLCAAVAVWYADLAAPWSPALPRIGRSEWLGWEGRLLVCGLGAAAGLTMVAYLALTAYLAVLICWKLSTGYSGSREGDCR